MAKVHVTVLEEMTQKLWIKQQPLLLLTGMRVDDIVAHTVRRHGKQTRLITLTPCRLLVALSCFVCLDLLAALDEVARRAMSTRDVRAMLRCVTVEKKREFKQKPPTSRKAAAARVQSWITAAAAATTAAPSSVPSSAVTTTAAAAAAPSLQNSGSRDDAAATSVSGVTPHKRRRRSKDSTTTADRGGGCSRDRGKEEKVEETGEEAKASVKTEQRQPLSIEHTEEKNDGEEQVSSPNKRRKVNASASDYAEMEMITDEEASSPPLPPPPPQAAFSEPMMGESAESALEDASMDISTSAAPLSIEEEKQQLTRAIAASLADQRNRPGSPAAIPSSSKQRQVAHDNRVRAELQVVNRVLRPVHGNGDCLFAAVLLGCDSIGIRVHEERRGLLLTRAHASCLRAFVADWIRTHKEKLFEISGGDESWRGDYPVRRTRRRSSNSSGNSNSQQQSESRMTLDDCLDLLADTSRRAYDIPWSSVQPGAAQTNLGDYLPQLIATALEIRITLLKASGPCETVGVRDSAGSSLRADTITREVMIVQNLRQDHWDAALPLAVAADAAVATAAVLPPPITAEEEEDEEEEEAAPNYRRRVFADQSQQQQPQQSTMMLQDLVQAQQHQLQVAKDQHATSLLQLEEEARLAAKEVAKKTRRIDELVATLQVTHSNHMQRVQSAVNEADVTSELLQQISTLQTSLPSSDGNDDERPFFHVPQALVDQWALDIEELEVALGSPFRPSNYSPPEPLDDTAAQQVCARMTECLRWLESNDELPFAHKVLMAKKLLCVDQLRPPVEEEGNSPSSSSSSSYQLLELRALLLRLFATDVMWSFALRLPVSFFEKSKSKMQRQSAGFYVKAAQAAAPDVLHQSRLLVEQCKVLDHGGLLRKAKQLNSVALSLCSWRHCAPRRPRRSGLVTLLRSSFADRRCCVLCPSPLVAPADWTRCSFVSATHWMERIEQC